MGFGVNRASLLSCFRVSWSLCHNLVVSQFYTFAISSLFAVFSRPVTLVLKAAFALLFSQTVRTANQEQMFTVFLDNMTLLGGQS